MSVTTTAGRRVLRVPVSGGAEHRAGLLAVGEPLDIGFLRGATVNAYAGAERVKPEGP